MDPSEVAHTVRQAAAGDQAAWNRLVESYSRMLWGVASEFRLGHADTAEIIQVTWLRLVEHLDRIKQPEAIGGWLATTARREALRMLRLRSRESLSGDELPVEHHPLHEGEPGPAERLLADERRRLLRSAFRLLPEHCRTLLHLLTVVVASYAEVSALLDMPLGSIGPTRARCLDRLRRILAEDDLNGPDDV